MLTYTKENLTKEAFEKVKDVTYQLTASIDLKNRVVENISCQITKDVFAEIQGPEGMQKIPQSVFVGNVYETTGRLNFELNPGEDPILHLTKFNELKKEIEASLQPQTTTK